jgi:hypothetical protein
MQQSWAGQSKLHIKNKAIAEHYFLYALTIFEEMTLFSIFEGCPLKTSKKKETVFFFD